MRKITIGAIAQLKNFKCKCGWTGKAYTWDQAKASHDLHRDHELNKLETKEKK